MEEQTATTQPIVIARTIIRNIILTNSRAELRVTSYSPIQDTINQLLWHTQQTQLGFFATTEEDESNLASGSPDQIHSRFKVSLDTLLILDRGKQRIAGHILRFNTAWQLDVMRGKRKLEERSIFVTQQIESRLIFDTQQQSCKWKHWSDLLDTQGIGDVIVIRFSTNCRRCDRYSILLYRVQTVKRWSNSSMIRTLEVKLGYLFTTHMFITGNS